MGAQLSELRAITSSVINEKEKLRALMQQDDKDFLLKYRDAFKSACVLLDAENPALQRPVFEAEMSVYIPEDFGKQLLTVGSVGGGPDIINLKAETVNGLLRLNWDVQETEHVKIDKYEIEYELLPLSLDSKGPTSVFCNGQAFHYYVNPLRPGYTYTFRMRCSIYSGWGMWTTPFTAKYDDFPLTISYTRRIVQLKIPATGRYQITAKGAKAADGKHCRGGRGAIISAVFTLQEGDILDILCGGKSDCQGYHSGGGGGTFVSVNTRDLQGLLVVAGGGGGTRGADDEDVDGLDANLEPRGTMANATNCAEGGIDGAPGKDAMFTGPAWGHGGAGWQQSSTTATSFVDGGDGGECGGFGGGGGVGMYGGGGGGGFSGGGGGRGGGGGGSYVRADGDNITKEIGHMEHGEVIIVKLPNDSSANNTNEIIVLSHTSSTSSSKEIAVLSPGSTSLSSTSEQ